MLLYYYYYVCVFSIYKISGKPLLAGTSSLLAASALVSYSLAVRIASRFFRWISSMCVSSIFCA